MTDKTFSQSNKIDQQANNQTQQVKKQTNHNAEVSKMDTVYRQAAIDAMCSACWDWCDEGVCKRVSAIQQLPPAQPEIIRCKDCKYADDDGVCQHSMALVIQDDDDFCSRAERREVSE